MNNFINPADPVTSDNAKAIVSKFMARIEQIRGGGEVQTQTPAPIQAAAPEQSQEPETQKVEDMQRYLAPIKMNKFNPQGYSDSHHEVFTENLTNDPVFEKIGPIIEAFSSQLKQGVASGAISPDRAKDEIDNFKRDVIYPIVHEAHGPHSETHKESLLAKKKAEIPEFVKQVTGAK
ncbi:hypothetical protein IGV50_004416 [Salmonella enterica subsp. enterica serovar Newport]|nr:hypothetical protein [Salmonella enterica subsp. enterica serovar Newport]